MGPRAGPSGLIDRYLYYNLDPGPQYNYLMPQFTVHVDKLVLYSSEVNNLLTKHKKMFNSQACSASPFCVS